MNTQPMRGGTSPLGGAAARRSLLQVLRDRKLYGVARALLSEKITRMDFPGALPYWTYQHCGDEILVDTECLQTVTKAIATATGRPRLKPSVVRSPNGAFSTLRLSPAAKNDLVLEMLALGAHLSTNDLAALPPPLDLQH